MANRLALLNTKVGGRVHLVPSLCVLQDKTAIRLICDSVVCCPVQTGSCCRVLAVALTLRHGASEWEAMAVLAGGKCSLSPTRMGGAHCLQLARSTYGAPSCRHVRPLLQDPTPMGAQ